MSREMIHRERKWCKADNGKSKKKEWQQWMLASAGTETRTEHGSRNGDMHIPSQSLWLEAHSVPNQDRSSRGDGPKFRSWEAVSFPLSAQPHA